MTDILLTAGIALVAAAAVYLGHAVHRLAHELEVIDRAYEVAADFLYAMYEGKP